MELTGTGAETFVLTDLYCVRTSSTIEKHGQKPTSKMSQPLMHLVSSNLLLILDKNATGGITQATQKLPHSEQVSGAPRP